MPDEDQYYEIPEKKLPPAPVTPAPAAAVPPEPEPPVRPPPPSAPPEPPAVRRRNWRLTLGLAAIGAILIIAIIAFLSFSVAIGPSTGAGAYPYTVTYDVVFPNAESVLIGGITILAIPGPENVTLSVDGVRHDIRLGEKREISAKHATVTLLGLSLLSFEFTLEAEYRGMVGQDASFGLSVRTSEQVPKFLIDRLVPASVQAKPA